MESELNLVVAFTSAIEFLKALLWPGLILFIFISVKSPLIMILRQIPEIAAKTSRITVGGVNFEIKNKLEKRNSSPELQKAMSGLTTDALKELLESGSMSFKYLSENWKKSDSDAPALHELESKGLIEIYSSKRNPEYPFEYKVTELGKQAYNILLQSIIDSFIKTEIETTT